VQKQLVAVASCVGNSLRLKLLQCFDKSKERSHLVNKKHRKPLLPSVTGADYEDTGTYEQTTQSDPPGFECGHQKTIAYQGVHLTDMYDPSIPQWLGDHVEFETVASLEKMAITCGGSP